MVSATVSASSAEVIDMVGSVTIERTPRARPASFFRAQIDDTGRAQTAAHQHQLWRGLPCWTPRPWSGVHDRGWGQQTAGLAGGVGR